MVKTEGKWSFVWGSGTEPSYPNRLLESEESVEIEEVEGGGRSSSKPKQRYLAY